MLLDILLAGSALALGTSALALAGQVRELSIDSRLGVLTNPALRRRMQWLAGRAVIYGDIDDLKRLNGELGQDEVNRRLARALQIRGDDVRVHAVGRWQQGDEFVAIPVDGNPRAVCARLQEQLATEGMSATWAWSYARSDGSLEAAVLRCQASVEHRKADGRKGTIDEVVS